MKLLKRAKINAICLFQEYHTPLIVTKKGRPRTYPDPACINATHYPDNVPATDLAPKRDCTVCAARSDRMGRGSERECASSAPSAM